MLGRCDVEVITPILFIKLHLGIYKQMLVSPIRSENKIAPSVSSPLITFKTLEQVNAKNVSMLDIKASCTYKLHA